MANTDPKPLGVRLDEATLKAIDEKRMELARQLGKIPTRSDVMRFALDAYIGTTTKPSKRK